MESINSNDNQMKLVSFVLPCYCSEKTLPGVVAEIDAAMERLPYRHEIIMVNDCSKDGTWQTIRDLCRDHAQRFGITFARNFGQHAALMAGIRAAKGDVVVCLDDDGQTPADEVGKLLSAVKDGADVCYARYEHKQHSSFRNFGSFVNEKMAQWLLEKPKDLYLSSYFAMRRFVADEVCRYNNSYAYLPGLVLRSTKNIVNVDVNHRARKIGQSGYSFKKLLNLWLNGFTSFSVKPLRLATMLGAIFAGAGFLYGIYTIIKKLVNPDVPVGFSAMMCAIIFFGGMLMLMVGMVGEYVGRTFISSNSAPQFVIRDTTGNLEIHRTEAGIIDAEQKN
ncbi:MAG: glycosyltransferase family 2 protein [Lachnospiraceae bacterium]|jgi:glycosyltransferase involved in cell wall biosynthesis